jgi:hypothetical protein
VREYPQIFENISAMEMAGVSADQKWVLISQKGSDLFLSGPMCVTIPLMFLPDAVSDAVLRGVGMDYFVDQPPGWTESPDDLEIETGDVYLESLAGAGFVVRGLAEKLPQGARQLIISGYPAPGVYVAGIFPGNGQSRTSTVPMMRKTSVTVVLRTGKARGELDLAGFVNGDVATASDDGQWVSAGTKDGPVYRRVAGTIKEAAAQEPISDGNNRRRFFTNSTAPGDNVTTRVSAGVGLFELPVIETTSGPATIRKYATVASMEVTTRVIQQQTYYENVFVCSDVGAEVVDLRTSASHRVSLRLPGEGQIRVSAKGVNAIALRPWTVWAHLDADWDQPSQTMSLSVDGAVRVMDFSGLARGGEPKLTVAPELGKGAIVGPGTYAQWGGEQRMGSQEFWVSEW